jgi:AcrR family transcriptional regulator
VTEIKHQSKADATRGRILAATRELMLGEGPTSFAAIATRAGISVGGVQNHFRSKADLVIATLEQVLAEEANAWESRIARIRAADDPAALVDAVWEEYDERRLEIVVAAQQLARSDPALAERVMARTRGALPYAQLVDALGLELSTDVLARLNVVLSALRGLTLLREMADVKGVDETIGALRETARLLLAPVSPPAPVRRRG